VDPAKKFGSRDLHPDEHAFDQSAKLESLRLAGREDALAEQAAPPFPRPHPGRGLKTYRKHTPEVL